MRVISFGLYAPYRCASVVEPLTPPSAAKKLSLRLALRTLLSILAGPADPGGDWLSSPPTLPAVGKTEAPVCWLWPAALVLPLPVLGRRGCRAVAGEPEMVEVDVVDATEAAV
jgi:hypothetical protein